MKDEPVPDTDHIARYCGGGSLTPKGKVSGAHFKLRTKEGGEKEDYLSVNWLEFLGLEDRQAELHEVRRVLATKITVGSKAKIVVLNVEHVKRHVFQNSPDKRELRILHRPDEPPGKPDPSHSGIFDTLVDEEMIIELIAQAVSETYPAR